MKSFVLHSDLKSKISRLTREEKGALLEAILAFENEEDIPDDLPLSSQIAFDFILPQLEADIEKYSDTVQKRKKAAESRWDDADAKDANASCVDAKDANASCVDAKDANAFSEMQMDANTKTNTKTKTKTNIKETLSDESVKKSAPKHKHGEHGNVLLTDSQLYKLKADYGEAEALRAVDYLDNYIAMKGYKARDHNLAMRKWVFDAIKEDELKAAELKEREARIKGRPPDKHGQQRGTDYDSKLLDSVRRQYE